MNLRKKKIELKPCPFCGGEAKCKEVLEGINGDFSCYKIIRCKECGVEVTSGYCYEKDDIEEKWNRRV